MPTIESPVVVRHGAAAEQLLEEGRFFLAVALSPCHLYYQDAEVEDRAIMLADGLYIARTSYVPGPPTQSGAGIQSVVGPLL